MRVRLGVFGVIVDDGHRCEGCGQLFLRKAAEGPYGLVDCGPAEPRTCGRTCTRALSDRERAHRRDGRTRRPARRT